MKSKLEQNSTGPESNVKSAEDVPMDPEACWKLLERVAASSHPNRAPRLREFLFYVGSKSLKEGITDVHEQEIGAVVFGRQAHYDTSQDNIVRVNATELRKRIDAYFISDGVNEPLCFHIPRGGYKPVFRRQTPAVHAPKTEEAPPVAAETPVPTPPVALQNTLPLIFAIAASALLAIVCLFLWRQVQSLRAEIHPWQNQPALAAFWSGFLDSDQDTDIILGDTSFALVQDISGQSYPLHDYLDNAYLPQLQLPSISADRRADLNRIESRLNGSMGDFGVAEKIKSLDPSSAHLFFKFAREYTADDIKRNNTILIGSRKSNPWVDLFSDQMNFLIEYDPALNQSFVKNLKPKPGEQPVYTAPLDPNPSAGYSIVAYLPNPSHTTNSLIIAGTTSQATNAAGEFVTSEESIADFRKRFPGNKFTYFEVLLKTNHLNGTPFKAEIIAYRIY